MGKITNEEKLRRKIKRILKEKGTVLFIGSGISAWAGLPTWGRLMEDMAEYIDKKGASSDEVRKYSHMEPLMAADFGCDELSSEEFEEFIKSSCKYKVAKPHMIHNLIVNLGPTCYITTNYDDLLEQTLKKRGLMRKYNIVTNNDPTKCGTLIQLKSDNFIFKPHGDLGKPDSIILSGNQYNDLYNNGTKYYTYRSLETLLLTRNIIFIGFGLKDPDFLSIMGKIKNEYAGNPITHYAIMADVTESEQTYWDKNYRIQILSYKTNKNKQGSTSHYQLLSILESLINKNNRNKLKTGEKNKDFRITKKHKNGLAKYATYVLQKLKVPEGPIFPLLINGKGNYKSYEGERVSEFIKVNHGSFTITGNPGSGKTFFLKQYSSYMAEQLFEWTQGSSMKGMPKIPIFIDLRDYKGKGSLKDLIADQFPDEVPLLNLLNENKICLLFDGFNEIEESEQKLCKNEIKTYDYQNDIVIATRFSGALYSYRREYTLESIEPKFMMNYVQQMGIEVPDEIIENFIDVFKNPLLFYLFASNKIVIDSQISINRIFESYLENLYKECYKDFGIELDFKKIFCEISYKKFRSGQEVFNQEEIEEIFALKLPNVDFNLRKGIINNLIDKYRFLVPGSYNGVSFFHQQITEYFAAIHFSILYKKDPTILNDIIQYKDCDFILGLASTFFEKKMEEVYLSKLLERDLLLAIKCVTYMAGDNKHIAITKILEELIKNIDDFEFDFMIEIEESLNYVTFDIGYEALLRELKSYQDIVGGAAATGLLKAFNGNQQMKNELINELFQEEVLNDYNYIVALGKVLSKYITIDEFQSLIERAGELKVNGDEECFSSCIKEMAINLKLSEVISVFNTVNSLNNVQRNSLAEILMDSDEDESFDLCVRLLEEGWNESVFPLYMQLKFKRENINLKNCEIVLYRLMQYINEKDRWAIELMYQLYQKSIPFAKLVRSKLKYTDGILKLVFFYCIGKNRRDSFFSLYNSLLYFNQLPNDIIDAFSEEDWTENADHIICYLSQKDRLKDLIKFTECIVNSTKTRFYRMNLEATLAVFNLVKDLSDTNDIEWELDRIGELLKQFIHEDELFMLYKIIDKKLKYFFHIYVLNRVSEISLEDFTDFDIEQMLIELQTYEIDYGDEILLANIASEDIVHKKLIPLLESNNEVLTSNIRKILYKLSEINQIRYI